ncbi:MFS transporter [Bacillus sp. NPDC093026]|uniref:MFS transporter n=1 Tax=Bacillus sp. NPDC093026 TaxID=3363948 RepID=UPI0038261F2C
MSNFNLMDTTLKVRLISNFFQQLITTAFIPFIALYLNDMMGTKFAGIFLVTLVLINMPLGIIGGYIIDVFSRKKTVIIYQFIMTTSLFFMGLSLTSQFENIFIFCLSYIIFSIIWGLQFPAMDAIIMDAITPKVENFVFKFDYWLENTAIALGMFLGGVFYHTNKSALIFLSSLIFFFVLLSLWKWFPNLISVNKTNKEIYKFSSIIKSYKQVFKDKRYVLLIVAFSLLVTAELSTSSYVALRLQEDFNSLSFMNFTIDGVRMFSLVMITNTIIVVSMSFLILKVFSKFSNKASLIIGLTLYLIGYTNITHLNSFYLLIFAMAIAAIGEIIYSPIVQEQKYKLIPQDKRGSYSAIGNVGFNLSELLARLGIILGTFLSVFGMTVYMLLILLIGSIGLYLAIHFKRTI